MFDTLFNTEAARRRHREAPFAAERECYLQRRADCGVTRETLQLRSWELLQIARLLDPNVAQGVSIQQLRKMIRQRTSVRPESTAEQRMINIARPWLRFLRWWRAPVVDLPFQNQLDRYVSWMRDERGLSALTVKRWQRHVRIFLQWCVTTDRRLDDLQPNDIDQYFVNEGAQRW